MNVKLKTKNSIKSGKRVDRSKTRRSTHVGSFGHLLTLEESGFDFEEKKRDDPMKKLRTELPEIEDISPSKVDRFKIHLEKLDKYRETLDKKALEGLEIEDVEDRKDFWLQYVTKNKQKFPVPVSIEFEKHTMDFISPMKSPLAYTFENLQSAHKVPG